MSTAAYKQAERMITATTPVGPDDLLLVAFSGVEAISQLFTFQLDFVAKNATEIPFEKILGQKFTVHLSAPGDQKRHFSGICSRISQGEQDEEFTPYRVEMVPEFWFLTRRAQSRIFQNDTVTQILQKVLQGLKTEIKLQGKYEPRDYCVQYRETDFNFACRLMEEEGIFYYFKHTSGGHTLVVADTPDAHIEVPFRPTVEYAALASTNVAEERVTAWEKVQDLRSQKFTLWDHCFELPHKHLEAEKILTDTAQVGKVSHKLRLGVADKLEIYDWPGEYAQRFDGVDAGRADRASDVQKIFQDNKRTTDIRMQQEAALCLSISGASQLRQMTAGHRFTLSKHFNADGPYLLTSVHHQASVSSNYRSGDVSEVAYSNSFTCLPSAIPFRPQRTTPKPIVQGTQTAVVVGPKGEELYTDKYGRVKVQFHWDREGKNDEKSSCWVRVGQPIAGKRWGASFWPRIGQEVIVDYLEGDPDQPIIMGSVYNADQMPPYLGKGPDSKHADDNLVSGIKTNTSKGGDGYNELRFFDGKDKEQIFMHAERDLDVRVKNDTKYRIYGNHHHVVGWEKDGKKGGDLRERVYEDRHVHIHKDHIEHVEGNVLYTVGKGKAESGGNVDILVEKNWKEKIEGSVHRVVQGSRTEKVDGTENRTIGVNRMEKVGQKQLLDVGQELTCKSGQKIVLEAGMEVIIKGAGGFIKIDASGIQIEGTMVKINCMSPPPPPIPPAQIPAPEEAQQAKPTDPSIADDAKTGQKSCP